MHAENFEKDRKNFIHMEKYLKSASTWYCYSLIYEQKTRCGKYVQMNLL